MNIAQHPACQPTNLENHFESEGELYNNMFWLLFTEEIPSGTFLTADLWQAVRCKLCGVLPQHARGP